LTHNKVTTSKDQRKRIPTIEKSTCADDYITDDYTADNHIADDYIVDNEFNRLYSQYRRAGYELIAIIQQQKQKSQRSPGW